MQHIDISPPINVYATFGRLNYTPWHAIAEFVDNSTQSYFAAREAVGVDTFPELRVHIRHQGGSLTVRDNAAGMRAEDLARALRLSTPPADTSGRSEFGMGLKTAACWFGKLWTISTTQAGERWRHTVVFDVDAIADGASNTIEMLREPALEEEHGTVLTIERLARPIAGRQVDKTKRLLAGIYRHDLGRGDVVITWNGESLRHEPPQLMQWEVDGVVLDCRVPIDLEVEDPHTGEDHRVTGWVGSLAKMSEQEAGFALFRRGRMIIGGPGHNWRVKDVVGSLNSHSGKRLVGELHMDDFPVNFTKDGFAWDGGLHDQLIDAMSQAVEEVRRFADNARVSKAQIEPQDFVRAVDEVQKGLDHPTYRDAVSGAQTHSQHEVLPIDVGDSAPVRRREVPQELKVPLGEDYLRARLELVDGGPQQSWLSVAEDEDDRFAFVVSLNTGNRFVSKHLDDETERTLVAKFALAVACAEAQARAVFGDEVPPDELREFLNLTLDHSAT
ncbi:ATP-binding protein [Nocardioides sp.]|uniref:ATP-binding protein n=1 Tax=Nocardioides sp. TaxID=35761 RepID=UPI0035ADE54C